MYYRSESSKHGHSCKLYAFGELLFDVFGEEKSIGGAPLNFAAHFARLGGRPVILTGIGKDVLGEEAEIILKSLSVSLGASAKNELPTGQCLIELDENGIPTYKLLSDVAYDRICVGDDEFFNDGEEIFYFGTLALRSDENKKTVERILGNISFAQVFVDLNIRPGCYSSESILFALSKATILKFSDDSLELSALGNALGCDGDGTVGMIAKRFPNIKVILFTKGKDGSLVYSCDDGAEYFVPAYECKNPISTVGAGDSYGAAFLWSYLNGKSLPECGRDGAMLSSYIVGIKGAI